MPQRAWYWPLKLEYSISSISRVDHMALKFDRCISSSVNNLSHFTAINGTILNTNLVALRLCGEYFFIIHIWRIPTMLFTDHAVQRVPFHVVWWEPIYRPCDWVHSYGPCGLTSSSLSTSALKDTWDDHAIPRHWHMLDDTVPLHILGPQQIWLSSANDI